jgi:hypothetical protein
MTSDGWLEYQLKTEACAMIADADMLKCML